MADTWLQNVFRFCDQKGATLVKKTGDAINLLFDDTSAVCDKDSRVKRLSLTRKKGAEVSELVKNPLSKGDMVLQSKWKPRSNRGPIGRSQSLDTDALMPATRVDVEEKTKELRKEVSESLVPIVQKAYFDVHWDADCITDLIPFVKKCIYVCWMMVVQNPPLCFHEANPQTDIDTDKFKTYTQSGTRLDFVVWPALLLHQDGPLVARGIVQPLKEEAVSKIQGGYPDSTVKNTFKEKIRENSIEQTKADDNVDQRGNTSEIVRQETNDQANVDMPKADVLGETTNHSSDGNV